MPKTVRRALGLESGGRISFEIEDDGRVIVTRAVLDVDPVIGPVLDFLCRDIAAHPGSIMPISQAWMQRMNELVGRIEVDLNEPIEGSVDV